MKCVNIEALVGRSIILWILIITGGLTYIISKSENQNHIFQFGPNEDLYIIGIPIDTMEKYFVVVFFCFVNSAFRTSNHNILQSWIVNIVQDPKINVQVSATLSYELTLTSTIYNWFDFFMYMNILMSQIDMLLIEISSDVIMTVIVTNHYLRKKRVQEN
jgi:hypothetical protein